MARLSLLGLYPTVQEILDAHIELPNIDRAEKLTRECATTISTLFDELKNEFLKDRDPDERLTSRKVEQLIAESVRPLIDGCFASSDEAAKACSLQLLDEFIAECEKKLLPPKFIASRPGDMERIGYNGGELSRFALSHPDQFDKAVKGGLEGIGKFLGQRY